jgi:alpha-mannosidase
LEGLAGSAVASVALGYRGRKPALPENEPKEAFIVPNFHPASCGWLTTFSKERVYCANTYLDHLDRVRDDPNYKFALSEVNNMIAIMNFQPARIEEIKQRAKEGRVELVNANFLEMTVNLAGGEALLKEGVEGLRWQEQIMGIHPRLMWVIDTCGLHDQMGQISSGLGLEAMVYERMNKTGSTIHWAESPDGSRILALCPDGYASFSSLFNTKGPLSTDALRKLEQELAEWAKKTPDGAPVLVLAGSGDYSPAPLRKEYPKEFLEQWKQVFPQTTIHIAVVSDYLDAILPGIKSGQIKIPTMKGGTGYTFDAFWIECPRVKTSYRRNEQGLQAAETISTIASLHSGFTYPTQTLYESWILMLLNMDRNTLWGSAAGFVYESENSWDVHDRMEYVETSNKKVQAAALSAISPEGEAVALFNPLNWERNDPVMLELPDGKGLEGAVCQPAAEPRQPGSADPRPAAQSLRPAAQSRLLATGRAAGRFWDPGLVEGKTLCSPRLPSVGVAGVKLEAKSLATSKKIELPESIETSHYTARLDWKTGALVSLKLRPSGREILGGPANVIVAEKPKPQKEDYGDFMSWRPERTRLASSSDFKPVVTVSRGPLATTVELASEFYGGGPSRRVLRFYKDFPRIDFETEVQDIPNITVVVAEFPLAEDIDEVRRGIPCGFSHGAWAKPNSNLVGWTKGIVPAVRWSHYSLAGGGGVAILDRGLTGRELNERTPIIYLLNATDKYYGYPNAWLSGKGRHRLEYALVAHEGPWEQARIPQMAWEYNCPPVLVAGRKALAAKSFLRTSSNVIVEVARREGKDIEVRMTECLGLPGTAEVTLNLPHQGAALTDLRGRNPKPLAGSGPTYRFPVRPLQIVTIHFHAASPVEEIKPVTEWDKFVPEAKRAALHAYGSYKGHPPRGDEPQT